MKRFALSLAVALALSGTAAHAQDVRDDQSIVVTAPKPITGKAARRFVTSISSTVEGQLTRFTGQVCPVVVGLPEAYNAAIRARIREVAAAAGAAVANSDRCTANLVVIVAHDADALVKALRKKFPAMFAALRDKELRRALRDGPVHVWSIVETRNEDGEGMSGAAADEVPVLNVKTASRIEMSSQQAVVRSVMVLDDQALISKSTAQIADYVAMRTLAGARPPREGIEAGTILTLFDPGGDAPPGLTAIDRSFLEGIYAMRPTGRAISQRGAIAKRIRENSEDRASGD